MLPDTLDPLQFTYRANRCTDDSITVILHTLSPTRSRRRHAGVCFLLFTDDSAAFGTIVAFKVHYEDILGPEQPPPLTG